MNRAHALDSSDGGAFLRFAACPMWPEAISALIWHSASWGEVVPLHQRQSLQQPLLLLTLGGGGGYEHKRPPNCRIPL